MCICISAFLHHNVWAEDIFESPQVTNWEKHTKAIPILTVKKNDVAATVVITYPRPLLYKQSMQVAGIMDKFERQFEHLDVQTQTMEEAMSGVTTLTVPEVYIGIRSNVYI